MKDKLIIVVGGFLDIENMPFIKAQNPDIVICHRDNLHEFDIELQPELLKQIEEKETKVLEVPIFNATDFPIIYSPKKGKHNNSNKYLWKK